MARQTQSLIQNTEIQEPLGRKLIRFEILKNGMLFKNPAKKSSNCRQYTDLAACSMQLTNSQKYIQFHRQKNLYYTQ